MLALLAAAAFAAPNLPAAVTAPSCIGCKADVAKIEGRLKPADREALKAGKIVTIKEEDSRSDEKITGRVFAYGIIPATPDQVWTVLTDFEKWPEFLPKTKEVKVADVQGDNLWLYHKLKIMITLEYTVIYTFEPEIGRAGWVLDKERPHDIGDTTGFWEMIPVNGGRWTLATYHATVDTGMPVPAFVENFLTKESLPQIIEGLRDAVVQRTASTTKK